MDFGQVKRRNSKSVSSIYKVIDGEWHQHKDDKQTENDQASKSSIVESGARAAQDVTDISALLDVCYQCEKSKY